MLVYMKALYTNTSRIHIHEWLNPKWHQTIQTLHADIFDTVTKTKGFTKSFTPNFQISWGVMFGSRITLCFDSFQPRRFNGPTSRRVMGMVEEDITNLWDLAPAKMEIDASKGMEWVMSIDELNLQNIQGVLYLFSNQSVQSITICIVALLLLPILKACFSKSSLQYASHNL